MLNYFLKIFKSNSFKSNPIKTIYRGFILSFLIIFKMNSKFRVKFGKNSFYLNFIPLVRNRGGRGIFLYREKIESLMEFGHRFLNKGDIVIDGGANQGIFSTAFSSIVGNEGKVISIEPFYFYKDIIVNNSKINQFVPPTVFTNVLSDKEMVYDLDYSNGIGKSSIVRNFGSEKLLQIESITLDILLTKMKFKKVDLIKLDLEEQNILHLKEELKLSKHLNQLLQLSVKPKVLIKYQSCLANLNIILTS